MANDVTVNINADTGVPEAVDKSKKALGQMEKAMEGMNKKIGDFGKDLILSYIAPMVLLNKAFDYVSNKIEENKQKAKEALEFAAKGESKQLEPSTVKLARTMTDRATEVEEKAKAAKAKEVVTEDWLRNASEKDLERFYKRLGPGASIYTQIMTYENLARESSVQNAVRDIENANMLRDKGPGGFDTLAVQNAVFGMGTNPVTAALDQQLDVQRQQVDALQRIEAKLPEKQEDYTKPSNEWHYTFKFRNPF